MPSHKMMSFCFFLGREGGKNSAMISFLNRVRNMSRHYRLPIAQARGSSTWPTTMRHVLSPWNSGEIQTPVLVAQLRAVVHHAPRPWNSPRFSIGSSDRMLANGVVSTVRSPRTKHAFHLLAFWLTLCLSAGMIRAQDEPKFSPAQQEVLDA
jgi:hypothetical protein